MEKIKLKLNSMDLLCICKWVLHCSAQLFKNLYTLNKMSRHDSPKPLYRGFQGEWKPQPLVLSLPNDCGRALSWLGESEEGGGFNRKVNNVCLFG